MGVRDIKDAKKFITQKLQEAKLGHDEFFPHKTEYQQTDEADKILQAIEDIQDKLELPACPNCGGHLLFTDKNKGGGIKCVGYEIHDIHNGKDIGFHYQNGCGFRGYTMSITNPVKLEEYKHDSKH